MSENEVLLSDSSPVPSLNKDFPEVKKGERLGSEGEKRRREEGALK